jgi:hypothetical protein
MGVFVKFLVSMVMHLLWQRVGGKGAIPPVRLPRSNKPVIIPAVSTWQLMIAMWVLKKFWAQYGGQVKSRLTDTSHPIPKRIGSWLPDTDAASHAVVNAPATPATPASSSSTHVAPSALGPAQPSPAQPSHSTAAHQYHTQRLDDDTADDIDQPATSSQGSLLSSLRRSS